MLPLDQTWPQLVAGLQRRLGGRPRCPMCARHEMTLQPERALLTRTPMFPTGHDDQPAACVRLVCTICGNVQIFDATILIASAPP
ncbi:MAG: hypothetical protein ACR2PL_05925 [Dehalococcoidia bacterium]